MKTLLILIMACMLQGCATYKASERMLVCVGYCVLRGINFEHAQAVKVESKQ